LPRLGSVGRIARALDVSVDDLVIWAADVEEHLQDAGRHVTNSYKLDPIRRWPRRCTINAGPGLRKVETWTGSVYLN
jgi:hypothetical protein